MKLLYTSYSSILTSVFLILVLWSMGTESRAQTSPPELFSGERRVFVANGYSTTRNWPAVLQRKLDRYNNNQRVIEVINTYRSGTPIAKWVDVNTGERLSKWKKTLQPVLEGETQSPVILLAQQSLQWVYGDDRYVGIDGPNDTQKIEQGADAIELFVNLAKEDGADVVFMAMHIYKTGFEPQIENEKYGLEAALNRNIDLFYAGPDVWTPTAAYFPKGFSKDLIHPDAIGDEVIAQYWFARLLEFDGKDVPEWSWQEMEDALGGEIIDPGENTPPTANIEISRRSGPAPLTVTFDGSGSVDPDGVLVAYDWEFSDGTNDASEEIEHTFQETGQYTIRLTVVDDVGDSDTDQVSITVSSGEEVVLYGDATGDGTVSALDASEVLRHVARIITLQGADASVADVSGNGDVSALDASLILQEVVGLIDCFPADPGCVIN